MSYPSALTLRDAAAQISSGALRPSQILEGCLARIFEREPVVHAFEVLDLEGARAQAEALDGQPTQGPLHGIPVAVKDIIDVAGLPTGCGTPLRGGQPATTDAWIVQRLREAGAIIVGKTVTTEFAYFTPGRTRNPHDPTRTPGGSSSGSAAAVADGMVPLALGTQTAASTIRPAAYCGVAGLVATPATYPTTGITGLSPTLDSLGLITRDTTDLALAASTLLDIPQCPPLVRGPRLLLCCGDGIGALDEQMTAALDEVASALAVRGTSLQRLNMASELAALCTSHATIMAVEASHSLAREHALGGLSTPLHELLKRGQKTSEGKYADALAQVRSALLTFERLLREHDAILAPAAPGPAPVGMATGDPAFSRPWQALGLPTVAIPGLRGHQGLPLGIQIIGRPGSESHLLTVASWIETHLGIAGRAMAPRVTSWSGAALKP